MKNIITWKIVYVISKFMTFFGILLAASVLYKLGDKLTSSLLLLLLAIYMILTKLDSMERNKKEGILE